MNEPVRIAVYFDYLSPWCYIVAVRLQRIKEEYGDRIDISWRSYPLVPGEIPGRRISPHSIESRRRASLEEESISFRPWDRRKIYPTSSMPALQAAKCAQLQGEEAFQRFHITLFKAFFGESRNIGDRKVLINLAEEVGLDVDRFTFDFDQGRQKEEVMAEYEEGRSKCSMWGIPFTMVGERYPVMGASPVAMYRRAVDLCPDS